MPPRKRATKGTIAPPARPPARTATATASAPPPPPPPPRPSVAAPALSTATRMPPAPTSAPATPHRSHSVRARFRRQLTGTPGSLRIWTAVTIVGSLLFAIGGASAVLSRERALAAVQANTEQLVRLQTIRTRLVQADAEAANAFLVGGLEPAQRRAAYVAAIADASDAIPIAAGHNSAEAVVLADVNDSLSRYTGLVEAARTNNRQGLAVGATYLQQASALLRAEILPNLADLVQRNQDRVQEKYDRSADAGVGLGVVALIGLVTLAMAQVAVAMQSRRLINTGLAGATLVIMLTTALAGGAMLYAQSRANRAHLSAYAATVELAQARIDAFDARSAESLTLVARGSGSAYEKEFIHVATDARVQLEAAGRITDVGPAAQALEDYLSLHSRIREADNAGQFEQAVALATGGKIGSTAFDILDQRTRIALDKQSGRIVGELRGSRRPLRPIALLVLAGGLLAAVLERRGIAERLAEYR